MKKRVFAILMTFAMVFSMLPATALAVEGEGTTINLSEGSYTIETAGQGRCHYHAGGCEHYSCG